ncbi:hypothetical protein, partial [Geoalkalibacter halelectricus]
MSSILKALKKLEEQKAEKKEGAVNIARDILRTSRKAKKVENWILPTAVLALLLTGGMVAYALLGGFSPASEKQVAVSAIPEPEPGAAGGSMEPTDGLPVVDRPEALFAGAETEEEAVAEKVADATLANVTAHQNETAAALNETAQALKDAAEALKERVVFPKEVVVVSPEKTTPTKAQTLVAVRETPAAATPAQPAARTQERAPAASPPATSRTTAPSRAAA